MQNVINPFSEESKKILKNFGNISELPDDVFLLAKKKISEDIELENYDAARDVLSFYLIFLAAAFNYSPGSKEVRAVRELTKKILYKRIWFLLNKYGYDRRSQHGYDENFVSMLFSDVFDVTPVEESNLAVEAEDLRILSAGKGKEDLVRYVVDWRNLLVILKSRKVILTDLYLTRGYVLLSLNNLVKFYVETVGVLLDNYIKKMSKKPVKEKRLDGLGSMISKISIPATYKARLDEKAGGKLKFNLFPPCISSTLEGVSSGSRNYAITVLLTSFLSYARLCPIRSSRDAKISDYTNDISVVRDEILPVIYESAKNCSPPLFEDQPMEKLNVIYHLGLGLKEDFTVGDAGRSSWYFPPNCEKIRREAPSLCKPDKDCKEIKNPLNYYARKLFPKKERGKAKKKVSPVTRPQDILQGIIIKIHDGSGLIQRCPKCNRHVLNNLCVVHGDIEGVEDIRIKATLKQNNAQHWLILKREATEKALEIDLEKAKKLGKDAVLEKINTTLLGKKFQVEGKWLTKNFLVREIRRVE